MSLATREYRIDTHIRHSWPSRLMWLKQVWVGQSPVNIQSNVVSPHRITLASTVLQYRENEEQYNLIWQAYFGRSMAMRATLGLLRFP